MDTTHIIIRSAKAAGLDITSYSGRGMFGKRCVAIDTEGTEANIIIGLVRGCMDIAADENDCGSLLRSLLDCIEDARTDSLGMGMVMYWPNIEPPEDDASDNGECCSCGNASDDLSEAGECAECQQGWCGGEEVRP